MPKLLGVDPHPNPLPAAAGRENPLDTLPILCILVSMQAVQSQDHFKLELQGSAPLYVQIVDQIQSHVATGRLQSGEQLPTVRALASQLGINPGTVGRAYAELERAGVIVTHRGGGSYVAVRSEDDRLTAMREERLRTIIGRAALEALSLGYSPEDIGEAFNSHMSVWSEVRQERVEAGAATALAASPNNVILTGSHDLILDLLASHLRRRFPEIDLQITNVGSLGGLVALEHDEAHVAGVHLLDEETGDYNVPFVKRLLPGQEVMLITLVYRFLGLIVAGGNPKGINGLADLRRPGIRFINRQRGGGTRVLFDYKIGQLGITPQEIEGYDREVDTHVAVAAAVAGGSADAGLGIYGAARSFGLDFVPLVRERFDLVIPRRHYERESVKLLLETVGSAEFKQVVKALGGCDTGDTGHITVVK